MMPFVVVGLRRAGRTVAVCALLALICGGVRAGVQVSYTISIRPNRDSVHVSTEILNDPDPTVTIAMPVWVPGYYRRIDQWKGVSNVAFSTNGRTVTTSHPTDSTWNGAHGRGEPLTVSYDVKVREYGFDSGETATTMGQMGVHVDGNSAFLHPGVACMYVEGHKDAPCTLSLNLPGKWKAAAPLPRDENGVFTAPDYDVLNDSPVQAGRYTSVSFTARGHGFEIITTGKCRVSEQTLIRVCKSVAEAAIDLFGGWAPFDNYQFHFHFPPKRAYAGAGLEHRSSCVIVFSGDTRDGDFLQHGAHIVAHEFLHAWNVKALRPTGLGPFDYEKESPTPSLWVAEGVTDYYAYVIGARAGLWTPEEALRRFSVLWLDYHASSGRTTTSLADSSLHVWQSSDPSSNGSGGTNYYTKGLLAGWLLDVQIRAATGGKRSLDDAMRLLTRQYAVAGTAYPPDALLEAIRTATGVDVASAYKAYASGVDDLPVNSILPLAGVGAETVEAPNVMLGVNIERGSKEARVGTVEKGSAAEAAQIAPGDLLLKIDGERVVVGQRPLLAGKPRKIGDCIPIVIRRDTEERTVTVVVQATSSIELTLMPGRSAAQTAVWNGIWARSANRAR
ncbi:MAG TPA: PDZ domain-containing protein [Armatimonadota bacterium]|jgi:predicted metalloprotease with PDZ domain